jgi:DNA-binding MarR family transcriptional regulator
MIRPLDFDVIEEAYRQWSKRWPDAADSMATATSIMRAQQMILSAVDGALRPFGLTFARYEALVLLSFTKSGQLPLGKMGQRLMVHPTSVTNIIDRLAEDRLAERIPHPSDRRATLAQITPAGRALAAEATEAVNGIQFGMGGWDDRQMRDVIDAVRNLRIAAGDFELRTDGGAPV